MIKTLTKLAKKGRAAIPILNTVKVQGGVMTTTDMDFYISGPTALADGCYYAHGFDSGLQIMADYPVTDFPDGKKPGKITGKTVLAGERVDALRWVLLAARKEANIYYLNGVYFDWCLPDAVVVATDGHRLHSFQHVIDAERPEKKRKKNKATGKYQIIIPSAGAILPTGAVKIILDLVKETKAAGVDIVFYDNCWFTAQIGAATVEGKLIDGTFPDWRQVVPKGQHTTLFDPAEIAAIIPELKVLKRISAGSSKTLTLEIKDGFAHTMNLSGITGKKQWPVSMKWHGKMAAGFNALYLVDLCGGVMHYSDPHSPFKVVDRRGGIERTSVIMPLRI